MSVVHRELAGGGHAIPPPAPLLGRQALSDVAVGTGIALLAAWFLVGALQMPFAEARWTWINAPGTVPAIVAGSLLLQALLLVGRGLRRLKMVGGVSVPDAVEQAARWGAMRLLLVLAFAVVFVLLMGRVPFGVLTSLWVFAMIVVFRGTTLPRAALVAVITGATIVLVFTRLFLVPLP